MIRNCYQSHCFNFLTHRTLLPTNPLHNQLIPLPLLSVSKYSPIRSVVQDDLPLSFSGLLHSLTLLPLCILVSFFTFSFFHYMHALLHSVHIQFYSNSLNCVVFISTFPLFIKLCCIYISISLIHIL